MFMLSIPVSLLTSACITDSNLRTNMRRDSKFSKNKLYLIVFIVNIHLPWLRVAVTRLRHTFDYSG